MLPQVEDLKEFLVERSDRPVGEFSLLANTKDLSYLDSKVTQDSTYYYRMRSVDRVGNRSSQSKTLRVTMPFFDEVKLSQRLQGTLVAEPRYLETTVKLKL